MNCCYRVMLGAKSIHAKECISESFIGADYGMDVDFTGQLPDDWRSFNKQFAPVFLAKHPSKSKIAAGLACGALWTLSKGINVGDTVLGPDGAGRCHVGEVIGDYFYRPGEVLPHRRAVRWLDEPIRRDDMSLQLRNSLQSLQAVIDLSSYRDEIERLASEVRSETVPVVSEKTAEDVSAFAMEKHLEHFLVQNWSNTELGKDYDIYEEDGEQVGQQYATDTGPLDILAISKDKKILLVVELKKGRASDVVVGQSLRYMGYVQEELAEPGQTVKGIIIALEDDPKIRRALVMVPTVELFRYQISFKLVKG